MSDEKLLIAFLSVKIESEWELLRPNIDKGNTFTSGSPAANRQEE